MQRGNTSETQSKATQGQWQGKIKTTQSKNIDRAEYTRFMCLVSKTTQGSGGERILC